MNKINGVSRNQEVILKFSIKLTPYYDLGMINTIISLSYLCKIDKLIIRPVILNTVLVFPFTIPRLEVIQCTILLKSFMFYPICPADGTCTHQMLKITKYI